MTLHIEMIIQDEILEQKDIFDDFFNDSKECQVNLTYLIYNIKYICKDLV